MVSTQPAWPQPQGRRGRVTGGSPVMCLTTGPCPHSPAPGTSRPSTTRPPPTPVPRMMPKTTPWPRPAPAIASARTKQAASLPTTTGRPSAAARSATREVPVRQGMLAQVAKPVSGSMPPANARATGASADSGPGARAIRPARAATNAPWSRAGVGTRPTRVRRPVTVTSVLAVPREMYDPPMSKQYIKIEIFFRKRGQFWWKRVAEWRWWET